MNDWLAALPFGFDDLVQSVLASTAAVIVVLALRPMWQRRFGAASALLLWWLVPASLFAVMLPARTEVVAPAAVEFGVARADAGGVGATPLMRSERGSIEAVIGTLWLAGALLTAGYFVRQQRRFRTRLGRLHTLAPRVLVAEHADVGPAVLGLLQPRIVLPADFSERYDAEQQSLILAHERSHLRRGDLIANAVASGLRCLYWFNPLIHYAAERMRHDHELASDADVLRQFPNSRRRYADTLLNVQLAVPGLPVGCLWQSSHPLKERILMLKNSPASPALQRLSLAASLAVLAIGVGAAWAAQPARLIADGSESSAPPTEGAISLGSDRGGIETWLDTRIDINRQDRSLREALGDVAAAAGATLQEGELLDQLHPARDIDLDINDTPVLDVIGKLTAAHNLKFDFGERWIRFHLDEAASSETTPGYARISPPKYPASAIEAKQAGNVVLRVQVDASGKASSIEVERADLPGVFDAAAIDAVKSWTFNPALKDGQPVEAQVLVPICFSLDEQAECPAIPEALDGLYIKG